MKAEMKEALWEAYLKQTDILEQQKEKLKELGTFFFEDVSFLYKIYPSVGEKQVNLCDEKTGIMFENEEELYILRKENKGIFLKAEKMKRLLSDMITLFEEILPLGSVVDLKKDKLSEDLDVSKVENFRIVITKRFVGAGEGCFYPYGAVLYPIGFGGTGKVISFTPALIEKVIYTGYSDEMEDAFVFKMKYKLVVEQRRKSAGFATRQELSETEEIVRKWGK